MGDTRQRLIDGAVETVRQNGIAGTSARSVAAVTGVNQALIFYHFGSLADLLTEAVRVATRARVDAYRDRLAAVGSLRELLSLGRTLHEEERELGNVTVLAQLLAGSQGDPRLAEATAAALSLWVAELERTLHRLLVRSPLRAVLDVPGLAYAVSAAFIGMEMVEAADPAHSRRALDALDRLGVLLEVMEDLGPVATAALRRKLTRAAGR